MGEGSGHLKRSPSKNTLVLRDVGSIIEEALTLLPFSSLSSGKRYVTKVEGVDLFGRSDSSARGRWELSYSNQRMTLNAFPERSRSSLRLSSLALSAIEPPPLAARHHRLPNRRRCTPNNTLWAKVHSVLVRVSCSSVGPRWVDLVVTDAPVDEISFDIWSSVLWCHEVSIGCVSEVIWPELDGVYQCLAELSHMRW